MNFWFIIPFRAVNYDSNELLNEKIGKGLSEQRHLPFWKKWQKYRQTTKMANIWGFLAYKSASKIRLKHFQALKPVLLDSACEILLKKVWFSIGIAIFQNLGAELLNFGVISRFSKIRTKTTRFCLSFLQINIFFNSVFLCWKYTLRAF